MSKQPCCYHNPDLHQDQIEEIKNASDLMWTLSLSVIKQYIKASKDCIILNFKGILTFI
jgi:hypothetical protein